MRTVFTFLFSLTPSEYDFQDAEIAFKHHSYIPGKD